VRSSNRPRRAGLWVGIALALLAVTGSAGAEETLRIGTEASDAPFEYKDSDGALKGIEVELADALCQRMKIKCDWVNEDFDSLIPALQAHQIDTAIAQMSVTADRRKAVDFTDIVTIGPARWVAKVGSGITEDPMSLKGKTVGVQSGTTHERYVNEKLKGIADIRIYQTQQEVYLDLEAGRIDATLGDQTLSYDWLEKEGKPRFDYAGKAVDDPDIFGEGTAMPVRKGDDALRLRLNKALAEIIADGTYDKITKAYFPFSLRTLDSDVSSGMAATAAVVDLLPWGWQLAAGALVTLELAFASLAVGLVLGIAAATAKLSSVGWIREPVALLTNLIRGVPEFLILLICFYSLSDAVRRLTGASFEVNPFVAGVFALSIVFGAYASEVFRGALLAVPKGQMEAARAFGMRPSQIFFRIRLPQAWRFALPSLGNQWQGLVKDTSLVSVIGLEELMRKAEIGAGHLPKRQFDFYMVAALLFLVLWAVSTPIFGALEKRANRGVRRQS